MIALRPRWVLAIVMASSAISVAGCARPLRVARPTEGVEYVVAQVPGMVPQVRLERCTKQGCVEVYEVRKEDLEASPASATSSDAAAAGAQQPAKEAP